MCTLGKKVRAPSRPLWALIAALALPPTTADTLIAQSPAVHPLVMPSSWLQLRGGTDNAGTLPGTLEANWQFQSTRPVRGLSVAGGLVLIGTESADADAAPGAFADDQRGILSVLDATTGRPLWSHAVPSWIHGDPVLHRGRVVVTFGRWPMTHPGGVMAFDSKSGKTLWSFSVDAGIMPGPALDTIANAVLVAGGDGILYALDMATGAVQSQSGLESADAMSSPHLDKDALFLGAAGTLNRYSASRKDRLWSFHPRTFRDFGDIPVALSDSMVFTTGMRSVGFWKAARTLPFSRFVHLAREASRTRPLSSYRGWFSEQWLLAVRRSDGLLVWQQPLGIGLEVPRNTSGTPVVARNRVLVSSPVSQAIWAFDAQSGHVLWSRQLQAMHKGAVTITTNEVIFGDKTGYVTVLRLADGGLIGRCNAASPFTPLAPIIIGKTVFVATRNGRVYATPYDVFRRNASASDGVGLCFSRMRGQNVAER